MPVLVFRAIEGWCDRLQVLSHCFTYCVKYNTALCVDWSDYVWGGNYEFNFYDCFDVLGIKTVRKDWVMRLAKTGNMKFSPPCWDSEKMWAPYRDEFFQKQYEGEFMCENPPKVEGDILVTNGNGIRTWDIHAILRHLRFKPRLLNDIKKRLKDFDPNSVVVHLRGTDRPDGKGDWTDKCIEAVKDLPYQIYVITDQRDLWEKFHARVPQSKLVNPNSCILKMPPTDKHGTHQTIPPEMDKLGIKKWDYMVDLLTDWVALVTAQQACGRSESTYFLMARAINKRGMGEWMKLFGGWKPYSKSSQEYNETLLLSNRKQEEIQQSTGVAVSSTQDLC